VDSSPKSETGCHSSDEYLSLILESEIGHGATGVAHGATLELATSGGVILNAKVVVKLAFSDEQQDSLRHEYNIYQHLALRGVTGVVNILGLFDDLEGCAIGLVMTHAGDALSINGVAISHSQRFVHLTVSLLCLFLTSVESHSS
jgi:hypothetical protein